MSPQAESPARRSAPRQRASRVSLAVPPRTAVPPPEVVRTRTHVRSLPPPGQLLLLRPAGPTLQSGSPGVWREFLALLTASLVPGAVESAPQQRAVLHQCVV